MTAHICSHLLFYSVISIPASLFLSPHNIALKSRSQSGLVVVVIISVKKTQKTWWSLSRWRCVQNGVIFTGRRSTFALVKWHEHVTHKTPEWCLFLSCFLTHISFYFGWTMTLTAANLHSFQTFCSRHAWKRNYVFLTLKGFNRKVWFLMRH